MAEYAPRLWNDGKTTRQREMEEIGRQQDRETAAVWLEKLTQIEADLKADIRKKVISTELFYAMSAVVEGLETVRVDIAIPELAEFTE